MVFTDDDQKGVVARVDGETFVTRSGDTVEIAAITRKGFVPGTSVLTSDGLTGVVLGYRFVDDVTAVLVNDQVRELKTSGLQRRDEDDTISSYAVPVVQCVVRAADAGLAAVRQLQEPSDDSLSSSTVNESLSSAASTVRESRAGRAAMEEASKTLEETLKVTKKDGTVATLVDAARRLKEQDLPTKLATRFLSDAVVVKRIFAKVLGGDAESESMPALLSKATVDFAKSCLSGDSVPREARPALQAAVEAAIAASGDDTVLELRIASDFYDGPLASALVDTPSGLMTKFFDDSMTTNFAKYIDKVYTEGASIEATLASALNDDETVAHVQRASELTQKFASAVAVVDADERAKHFVSKLFDEDIEHFVKAIADLDVDDAVKQLENVVDGDAKERADLVDRANDAALDFLLRHLPAMPVPPVDIEKDGILYAVHNLNLSKFQLAKKDVRVDVPLVVDGHEAPAFFAVGDHPRLDDDDDDDAASKVVQIKARRMSAKFENLAWKFKQTYFPYFEGSGRADVDVEDAALLLEISVRRDTGKQPVLGLTRCQVEIAHLDLRLADKDSRLAWIFNALSQIFTAQVRDYVRDSLESFIADYVVSALASADDVLPPAWPALARVFKQLPSDPIQLLILPELDIKKTSSSGTAQQVTETEREASRRRRRDALMAAQRQKRRWEKPSQQKSMTVLRIALREPGPLGLDLVVAKVEGRDLLQLTGVRGQTAQLIRDRSLRLDKGSVLIQVDDTDVSDFPSLGDVVKAVTAPDRPKRLAFQLPSSGEVTPKKPQRDEQGLLSVESFEIFPASAPNRAAESIGVKLRRHDALEEAVEIADSATIPVGRIVVACTGAPRLVAPRGKRASPVSVGATMTRCLQRAAATGDAFSIAVAPPPDRVINLPNGGKDMVFQPLHNAVVLVGLVPLPSPLAVAGALPGDVVIDIAGTPLPTSDGYAADVGKIKDAVVRASKEGTFNIVLRRQNSDVPLTVLGGPEKLGVTFARCHDTDRPKIKRFDGVPGPVARSSWMRDLRPGLAVVSIDGRTVSINDVDLKIPTARSCVFRDIEAYDDMINRFAVPDTS